MQGELSNFRMLVEREDNEAIQAYYQTEMENRLQWLQDQASGDWGNMPQKSEIPTAGEFMSEMFLGGLGRKRRS
jgi:hypothetical protein